MDSTQLATELPPHLATDEAVLSYIEEAIMDVEDVRASYNVNIIKQSPLDGKKHISAAAQRSWERAYWLSLGCALGAIVMAFKTGRISEVAYNALLTQIRATAKPDRDQDEQS